MFGPGQPDSEAKGTLDRAFLILDAFTADDRQLTLAELSRRTGIPKPTGLRIARALVAWGALERTDLGYRLGMRMFELGTRARTQHQLRDLALPFMSDLYGRTHGTVHFAVLDGTRTLILEKIAGPQSVAIASRPGGRGPAHCTGLGKVLLAYSAPGITDEVIASGLVRRTPRTIARPSELRGQLSEIRRTGVGYECEESAAGVACVAAPVFTLDKSVVAAISVAGPAGAVTFERVAPAVRATAAALSRVVSARWWPDN